jgi:hypothetical protein
MAREGTEDNDICHRVTADAVTAVDPAHHFTGGKSAAITCGCVQHAVSVLMVTPPMVWCTPGRSNGVERAFIDRRTQRGGTAKVIIMLFFNKPL